MVQWLRLHTFTVEGVDQIPGWGTKIPQAPWHGQKKKGKIIYLPFLLLAQLKSSICLSWGQETEKETFSEEIRLGFLEEEP